MPGGNNRNPDLALPSELTAPRKRNSTMLYHMCFKAQKMGRKMNRTKWLGNDIQVRWWAESWLRPRRQSCKQDVCWTCVSRHAAAACNHMDFILCVCMCTFTSLRVAAFVPCVHASTWACMSYVHGFLVCVSAYIPVLICVHMCPCAHICWCVHVCLVCICIACVMYVCALHALQVCICAWVCAYVCLCIYYIHTYT